MESIDPVWQLSGIALIIGFLLGTVVQMLLKRNSGDIEKLKAEMEQTRSEMEQYKASVNLHFNKTSDLVNELTQDYVKVYQHLAEGAQNLSDTPVFAQMLEQSQGRVLISVEDDSVVTGAETEAVADPLVNSIDGSSKAAAANSVEADRVASDAAATAGADSGIDAEAEQKTTESTADDTTTEAEKKSTESAANDTATEDDRRDPDIGESPQRADANAATEAEADKDTAADSVKKT